MNYARYTTQAGEIVQVSFKDFLSQVRSCNIEDKARIVTHNTCVKMGSFGNAIPLEHIDESGYERRISPLMLKDEEENFLNALLFHARFKEQFRLPNFIEHVENWMLDSVSEFGMPTCLVELLPNYYATLSPDDFQIIHNSTRATLLCHSEHRLKVYSILPMSEEEAIEALNTNLKNF